MAGGGVGPRPRRRDRLLRQPDARARRAERRRARERDDLPDPRAAGRRRRGHHRRGQRGVRRGACRAPASSTRSSSTTERRTASSTASRRSIADASDDAWRRVLAFVDAPRVILAIDQGTTGHDVPRRRRGAARRSDAATRELPQHFPQPGWVEHDPEEIWESVARRRGGRARECRARAGCARRGRDHEPARDDAAVGPRAPGEPGRAARSSGRTGAPPIAARALDRELIRDADRARPRPVLLGDEARVAAARARLARGLAFGTVDTLARLEAHRRRACT